METTLFDLTGRTAVVTGGGRGIGLGIAAGLAQHGADIVLVARTKEQLERAAAGLRSKTGRQVRTFAFDVSRLEAIDGLFDEIIEATGGVDILVNCAGTTIRGPAEDIDLESWSTVQSVNLTAALRTSQALWRHCREQSKPGRIINIGSLTCHAARPGTGPYASSKMGLMSLTQTLAAEWAKYHINVNILAPGYIATELTQPLQDDPELDKWVLDNTPMGRWGTPEDMAGAAVLLASKGGEFITGQIIYVDGGWLSHI